MTKLLFACWGLNWGCTAQYAHVHRLVDVFYVWIHHCVAASWLYSKTHTQDTSQEHSPPRARSPVAGARSPPRARTPPRAHSPPGARSPVAGARSPVRPRSPGQTNGPPRGAASPTRRDPLIKDAVPLDMFEKKQVWVLPCVCVCVCVSSGASE